MICPNCGQENLNNALYCSNCGHKLQPLGLSPDVPAAAMMAPIYAGFWDRVLAFLIDGLILGAATFIFGQIFNSVLQNEWIRNSFIPTVISWLYYALFESSSSQATLGKQVLRIKVTDLDVRQINFGRATARHFGKIISGMILMIGFLMAAFTEKRQALHDLIAGTLVIKQ